MSFFERSISQAIALRRLGYSTRRITRAIQASCGTRDRAFLVACAAKVFVDGVKRRVPVLRWVE